MRVVHRRLRAGSEGLGVGLLLVLSVLPGVAWAQAGEVSSEASAEASTGDATTRDDTTPTTPAVTPVDEGERATVVTVPAAPATDEVQPGWARVHARHDAIFSWAPRYRLDVSRGPLGVEQQLWRRVETMPLYDRVSLDATYRIDETTSIALHASAWGALNLLEDAGGGFAAGDVAIGYAELSLGPVQLWLGRRFVTYGPPGGVHVDGGGASARTSFGLYVDGFVGRPVTPVRASLLGPSPSFEGASIAYGARVGWSQPGLFSAAASYAELWAGGIAASRVVDVVASGDPLGVLHLDGALKLDVDDVGVVQASIAASAELARELTIGAEYLHVEPGRWIPATSILSVFETTTFDEAMIGATVRPTRQLAFRLEAAGRLYSGAQQGEPTLGYRADLTARLAPVQDYDPALRVLVSRRDDGTIGYTLLEAGGAFDLIAAVLSLTLDGAFAIDDQGARLSMIGRASVDATPHRDVTVGGTLALAHTPFSEAELRAMIRARWTPEVE